MSTGDPVKTHINDKRIHVVHNHEDAQMSIQEIFDAQSYPQMIPK